MNRFNLKEIPTYPDFVVVSKAPHYGFETRVSNIGIYRYITDRIKYENYMSKILPNVLECVKDHSEVFIDENSAMSDIKYTIFDRILNISRGEQ